MPHIHVIPPGEAAGELKDAYERVRARRGAIANVHAIHSLSPPTMEAHIGFYLSIMFGPSDLSRQERETMAVAVSQTNGCDYCVAHHADALSRYQKNPQILRDVAEKGDSELLSVRESALVRYAKGLTRNPGQESARAVESLRGAGFNDEEILTATLVVSYFNFVNRLVLGLGVEPEAQVAGSYKY